MAIKKNEPKYYLLVSFLYVLMIINCMGVILSMGVMSMLHDKTNLPISMGTLEAFIGIFTINFIALRAMTQWRKWGFWCFCLTSLITAGISSYLYTTYGLAWYKSALSSVTPCILVYILYQIGGKKKPWLKLT
ncbi:MAG: hypothetical protein AB7F64_03095 [Gammaproteobacteria bacterium]